MGSFQKGQYLTGRVLTSLLQSKIIMDPTTQNLMPHAIPTNVPQHAGLPSGAPAAAPQPVIVIMQAPNAETTKEARLEHYKKTFPEKAILGMSIYCLVAGLLSILLQTILIISSRYGRHFEFGSQGIWCGIFFIIAGSLGIWAAKKPSQRSIVTLMVMTIISACMSIPHIVMDSVGLSMAAEDAAAYWRGSDVAAGLFGLLLVFGLTAGITLIIISAFTCRVTCCGSIKTNGTVMYQPSTAQTIQLSDLSQVLATTGQPVVYPVAPQQQSPPPTYSAEHSTADESKYKRFD